MRPLYKGLILMALHVAIVCSLGAKLLYDRATCPRVWVQSAPVDPDLFIRGRYVQLGILVEVEDPRRGYPVRLFVEDNRLIARRVAGFGGAGPVHTQPLRRDLIRPGEQAQALLQPPLAFFIPDYVPDPSVRPEGEELWVEVTVPKKGPPRPIRLGVKKNGVITPLEFN